MEYNSRNENNLEKIEKEKEKQKRNATIVAIVAIIFAIVLAFIAINNFGLFILICIGGTIIFSIVNAIVVSIKKRHIDD